MIDIADVQIALQQRLLTLSVCTTGSTTLSATSIGYVREDAGSFLADGFAPGMELAGAGFPSAANNAAKVITGVSALTITAAGCVAEGSGAGRTLSVGTPTGRAWEGIRFEPTPGSPYLEEELAGFTSAQATLGEGGDLHDVPVWVVRVHVPQNYGFLAARRYVDALRRLFPPRLSMAIDGTFLRVQHQPAAPFASSLIRLDNGFSFVAFTVPLWVRSANIV